MTLQAVEAIVLDTNATLEWLVFRDARLAALPTLLGAGRVRWLATPAMRAEFEHVIARPSMQAWLPDATALASAWDTHATPVAVPPAAAPWRCTDRSDQMFVDLAHAHGACALLTRDRSLLALARRARAVRLFIGPPERWLATAAVPLHPGIEPSPAG